MTEYPSPTSEEAANLLRQAETALTHIRGNAGRPMITARMSIDTTISVYLLANRDTQFDAVPFIGMMVWVLTPLILVAAFAKVAKNGFGICWGVYAAVWALRWSISAFSPTAAIRVPFTAAVAVASFVGALMEARR